MEQINVSHIILLVWGTLDSYLCDVYKHHIIFPILWKFGILKFFLSFT